MSCLSRDVKQNVPYRAVVFAFGLWDMAAAQIHCKPKDCYDLSCYRQSEGKDGPHTIYPDTPYLTSVEVSCDQATDDGGWIMYQRRVDGTLNFTRNWQEYKRGFGNNGGNMTELWLGNENVYQLLQSYGGRGGKLRIEVDAFDGDLGWIEACNFTMDNESLLYRIHWDTCFASGRGMTFRWNQYKTHPFKTFDKTGGEEDCLDSKKGGWWYYRRCGQVLLNGEYVNAAEPTLNSIFVGGFKEMSLKRSRMMFRPTNDGHTCNNPCQNGATCLNVADVRGYQCVCKLEYCGPACELVNPCKNGGACEYDETTKSAECRCSGSFGGPTCEDAGAAPPTTQPITPPTSPTSATSPTSPTPPTPPTTTTMAVIGGILLVLILICLCIAACVIYKRRQRKKSEDRLDRQLSALTFQEYILSILGF